MLNMMQTWLKKQNNLLYFGLHGKCQFSHLICCLEFLQKQKKRKEKKKHLLKALKKNTEYSDCININILKTLPGCPSSKKKKKRGDPTLE